MIRTFVYCVLLAISIGGNGGLSLPIGPNTSDHTFLTVIVHNVSQDGGLAN